MIESSAFPFLPIAWHQIAKECISDMRTASIISCSHLHIHLFEKDAGDLGIEATVLVSEFEHFNELVFRIGRKAIDSVSSVCCVCGYEGPCALLISAHILRWCCNQHESSMPFWVPREHLCSTSSNWDIESMLKIEDAVMYAAYNELALKDARDFDARHESEISRQFLAKVNSLIALDAINQLLDTKAGSCTS